MRGSEMIIEKIHKAREIRRCKNTYDRLMADGCGRIYKRRYPQSYISIYEQLSRYLSADKMALLVLPYDTDEPEGNSIDILDSIKKQVF